MQEGNRIHAVREIIQIYNKIMVVYNILTLIKIWDLKMIMNHNKKYNAASKQLLAKKTL